MAETDTWTPADDDYVREQLTSLKADVDGRYIPRFDPFA